MTETRPSASVREGPLAQLWAGDDLQLHAALLQELELAGIPFFDRPVGRYPGARHGITDFAPQPAFGFEIEVFSSDLAVARRILEKLTTPME